jgi:DNA repair protein SbcD/Mre11
MQFIHFSDTHLGYSDYNRIDPQTGINQREKDFYDAWENMIEEIINADVDFVVHAGDLFHSTRPTNRAIAVALEGIQQIKDAGIPFVLISGNHSTPKIRATGSIFESIDLFPNVYTAYKSKYEKFQIGNCAVHCIPHCSLSDELEFAFQQIEIDESSQYNILTTHGSWAGEKSFSMGEFNEQRLKDPELNEKFQFDYIALGHYHKHIIIKPHVVYSGSTEHTSFNEAGNPTGYMTVDLENGESSYHNTFCRPMIKLAAIDCNEYNAARIYSEMEKLTTPELTDALVSISLLNVQHDTLIKLENREIENIFSKVFQLKISISQMIASGKIIGKDINMGALPVEFERYIDEIETGELEKDRLKTMGLLYLDKKN